MLGRLFCDYVLVRAIQKENTKIFEYTELQLSVTLTRHHHLADNQRWQLKYFS